MEFVMDVGDLKEVKAEDYGTTTSPQEQKCFLSKTRPQAVQVEEELTLTLGAAESSVILSACPVSMSHQGWAEGGGGEEKSPSSMLESWVYIDDQHSMADSTTTPMFTFPTTLVTHRPCLLKSGQVNAAVSNSMTDTCSAFSPLCSPTGSAWDALRSTSKTPGCCDRDPVSAAAHLHLLGESLSLIGQHLRETDKMVCTSGSLSLLLDSLLCALAPLICLTAQIPELRNCTQPTLASTLENISYVMPGL